MNIIDKFASPYTTPIKKPVAKKTVPVITARQKIDDLIYKTSEKVPKVPITNLYKKPTVKEMYNNFVKDTKDKASQIFEKSTKPLNNPIKSLWDTLLAWFNKNKVIILVVGAVGVVLFGASKQSNK